MAFTRVALNKLNELLKRRGFVEVIGVDDSDITVKYTDRVCTISAFGNVKWFERPQE